MFRIRSLLCFALCVELAGAVSPAQADRTAAFRPIDFDARADFTPAPPAQYHGGTSRNPSGHTIVVNSRYLLLDGKPWLPVMGEFHYSRVPESEWEEELLKMKAGGVQIVSTYIFWIHQEEVQGQFDWAGQRDLRHFVQLCAKHGLYVYPRLGPWAHGEARNGGFPDWLLKLGPTRRKTPAFMAQVGLYYGQIAKQLRGLLWKDGGPVIGVQIENEYAARGPDEGAGYLMALKRLAIAKGIDVPLYSLTGWDKAVLPRREFLPVYGGYPDAPWDASISSLPPPEVYAFRFHSRVTGNMGMMGGHDAVATANEPIPQTPFITAEMGGGVQDTYHRRPVISADDIAAMMPVMLGSGVNLYGTYMFQGGVNPEGKLSTLQESQATGYPSDVPVKSYDFQAPLGSFGLERQSLRKLKVFNYFLQDFGGLLAPMVTNQPSIQPKSPADLSVPPVAIRSNGRSGFVFFNNYTRGAQMPARQHVQFHVRLRHSELLFPQTPVDLPSGAYGIWPFGLDLSGVKLRYATAQLMTRLPTPAVSTYVFVQTPDVPADFAIDHGSRLSISSHGSIRKELKGDVLLLHNLEPNLASPLLIRQPNGRSVRLVLLTQQQAEDAWKVRIAGQNRILFTSADFFADDSHINLRSLREPTFRFELFPGVDSGQDLSANAAMRKFAYGDGLREYTAELPAASPTLVAVQIKAAGSVEPISVGPALSWRPHGVASVPAETVFQSAAAQWKLQIDWPRQKDVSDLFLTVDYQGDIARLFSGDVLLDDDFYNGETWQVGLRRYRTGGALPPLTLVILPLREDAPIFLEANVRSALPHAPQVEFVKSIEVVPQYQLSLTFH